jgi:hypothetical protein
MMIKEQTAEEWEQIGNVSGVEMFLLHPFVGL